jgi:hypothetical protein
MISIERAINRKQADCACGMAQRFLFDGPNEFLLW